MLVAALLLASQPLAQRHIDDLSDAEICQAMADLMGQPRFQLKDRWPLDFGAWQVECAAKRLKLEARLLTSKIPQGALEKHFGQAEFCRAANIQRFLQRGWQFDMHFRWPDGRVTDIRTCG